MSRAGVRGTLVDTSAWVELLRSTGSPADRALMGLLASIDGVWTIGPIRQELLQGAMSAAQASNLARLLDRCSVAEPVYPETYDHAATLYRRCRRAGRAVRGRVDCLIAAVALEHDLAVLASDRDIRTLADVCGVALVAA